MAGYVATSMIFLKIYRCRGFHRTPPCNWSVHVELPICLRDKP